MQTFIKDNEVDRDGQLDRQTENYLQYVRRQDFMKEVSLSVPLS